MIPWKSSESAYQLLSLKVSQKTNIVIKNCRNLKSSQELRNLTSSNPKNNSWFHSSYQDDNISMMIWSKQE